MSRLTRDGTTKLVSRDQILRRERGQGNIHFPCSADPKQDWQPYPVDPYSALCDGHTHMTAALFSSSRVGFPERALGDYPGVEYGISWGDLIMGCHGQDALRRCLHHVSAFACARAV